MQLDFLEAVFGCSKDIEVERYVTDPTCSGRGVKAGTSPSNCPQCGGSGQVLSTMRTPLGMFQQVAGPCGMSGGWRA
jgi:molecular chaperone DnaJ